MKIKFKKLKNSAIIPSYAKNGDAGMDLYATSVDWTKEPLYWEYSTSLAVEIPEGYVGLLFPRSSISKTNHSLRNSVGVIDSGYRGEIKIRMSPDQEDKTAYTPGDKIAQLIIMKLPFVTIEEVKELSNSDIGKGGFGSTGK